MRDNIQIFSSLLDVFYIHLDKIAQLSLDNFLIFREPGELELLIKNDVGRYSLANQLTLPSDVFVILEDTDEFDPPMSTYEVAFVYKLGLKFKVVTQITLYVNHIDKFIQIDSLITGYINSLDKWQILKEDYKSTIMPFDKVSLLREDKMKGEIA